MKAGRTALRGAIHLLNYVSLVVFGVILLLAAVIKPSQLLLLFLPLFLTVCYWRWRTSEMLVYYCALSFSLMFWIVLCENIVTVDNILGTQITARLPLGLKLQDYVASHLRARERDLQECCNDPLSYNFRPGSTYRYTFDCPTCGLTYETLVDETGFLNKTIGLYARSEQIDVFLAGDSVMQGWGMPSVLESVRERIPLKMWNLSVGNYGPRNRIGALLTYALPKNPRWIVIEFFSANDPSDSVEDEACLRSRNFRCKFNTLEIKRQLAADLLYASMLDLPSRPLQSFDYYVENNFTLALTRYLIDNIKNSIKSGFGGKSRPSVVTENGFYRAEDVSHPGQVNAPVHTARMFDWIKEGMRLTHKSYERLITKIQEMEKKPTVILLYNPSAYEIYVDILVYRHPHYDEIAAFQMETQKSFATKHHWIFVDLTAPLRQQLKQTKEWIYGQYDTQHWSPKGTTIVAEVLTAELSKAIKN